jgi:hypothetical protein
MGVNGSMTLEAILSEAEITGKGLNKTPVSSATNFRNDKI